MYHLCNFTMFSNFARKTLKTWMGNPAIASMGLLFDVSYIGCVIVGMPVVIMYFDRNKGPDDITGGYTALLAIGAVYCVPFVLIVASMGLPPIVASMILSALQGMVLSVIKPAAKRIYVEDWVFCAPGILLSLEVGQAAVFLGVHIYDPQLYMAMVGQLGCACVCPRAARPRCAVS